MQFDESIYCSTLDSLEPESDLASPAGRLVLDYEETRDWPSLGLEEAEGGVGAGITSEIKEGPRGNGPRCGA